MAERQIYRPNLSLSDEKYSVLNIFSFAEFLRYYLATPKSKDNDFQSGILNALSVKSIKFYPDLYEGVDDSKKIAAQKNNPVFHLFRRSYRSST